MAEISLDRAGIDAFVGQLKPAGMPEPVRMTLHFEASNIGSALQHCLKTAFWERRAALAYKDKWRSVQKNLTIESSSGGDDPSTVAENNCLLLSPAKSLVRHANVPVNPAAATAAQPAT